MKFTFGFSARPRRAKFSATRTLSYLAPLWLLAILFAAAPASARVTMDCEVGFDAWGKAGRWLPAFVTLTNEPDPATGEVADFKGRVEFEVQETIGKRGVRFYAEVDLPANSRKRVTLYVKVPASAGGASGARVKLLRPNGSEALTPIIIDDTKLRLVDDVATPLILVVQPRGDTRLQLPQPFTSQRQREAHVDGASFPDSWTGLEAVDLVVIPRLTDSLFTTAQTEALEKWVAMGGRLLVYGGPDTGDLAGSFLDKMLPVAPLGVSERDIIISGGASRSIELADVSPREGSRVLYQFPAQRGDDIPVAWAKRYHMGETHFWAYSWRESDGEIWIQKTERVLWEALIRQNYQEFLRDAWRERFGSKLKQRHVLEEAAEPPNVAYVIALIFAYFLAVGPMNFMMLKKRRRLELAWLTIPAIVLVFSAGMYMIGVLTMGNENLRRDVGFIQAEANSPRARITTESAFFSARPNNLPANPGSYDTICLGGADDNNPSIWSRQARSDGLLQKSGGFTIGGSIPAGGSSTLASLSPARIAQGDENFYMSECYVSQWTWTMLESEGEFDLGGAFETEGVEHYGDRLVGEVVNNTKFDLEDAFVMTLLGNSAMGRAAGASMPSLSMLSFGAIKQGASINLDVKRSGFVAPALQPQYSPTGDRPLGERLNQAVEAFAGELAGLISYPRGRVFLCGYINLPSPNQALSLGAPAHQFASRGLVVIHLPVSPVRGAPMPAWHATLTPVLVDSPNAVPKRHDIDEVEIEDAQIVFRLESPFDSGVAEVTKAVLHMDATNSANFTVKSSIKEFDRQDFDRNRNQLTFSKGVDSFDLDRHASALQSAVPSGSQTLFVELMGEAQGGGGFGTRLQTTPAQFKMPALQATYAPID